MGFTLKENDDVQTLTITYISISFKISRVGGWGIIEKTSIIPHPRMFIPGGECTIINLTLSFQNPYHNKLNYHMLIPGGGCTYHKHNSIISKPLSQ
jgi:hypothetical protein